MFRVIYATTIYVVLLFAVLVAYNDDAWESWSRVYNDVVDNDAGF